MKIVNVCICLLLTFNKQYDFKVYYRYPIYMDVINEYVEAYDPKTFSILTNFGTKANSIIRVLICTDRGKMKFTINNPTEKLFLNGQYVEAIKITENLTPEKRSGKKVTTSGPKEYYKPLRDGRWDYFNVKHKLIKSEFYQKGILLKRVG